MPRARPSERRHQGVRRGRSPRRRGPSHPAGATKTTAAEIPRAASGQSLLRTYAATNPAELLAEAVAAFVELPGELKQRVPALYGGLVAALRQDPVAWMARQERERGRAG